MKPEDLLLPQNSGDCLKWWRDLPPPPHAKLPNVCACSRSSKTQRIPLRNYKVAIPTVKSSVMEGVLKSTCVIQALCRNHLSFPCSLLSQVWRKHCLGLLPDIRNLQSSWNLGEQHRACNTAPFTLLHWCSSLIKTILSKQLLESEGQVHKLFWKQKSNNNPQDIWASEGINHPRQHASEMEKNKK